MLNPDSRDFSRKDSGTNLHVSDPRKTRKDLKEEGRQLGQDLGMISSEIFPAIARLRVLLRHFEDHTESYRDAEQTFAETVKRIGEINAEIERSLATHAAEGALQ